MPTYEYRCVATGEQFDIYQSFTEDALTACPLVHGEEGSEPCSGDVRKVFGKVGVSFKGSGFYKTDSRSAAESKKSAASSEAGSKSGSETKSADSKSDSSSKDNGKSTGSDGTASKSSSSSDSGSTKSKASTSSGSRSS